MGRYTLRTGNVELIACCDDAFARQAESLLKVVASFHGKGKGLADGVTVQFGFSLLTLHRQGSDLLVCEPGYGGDPFHEVRQDVTCTLAVLTGQAAVVNRLGIKPVEVRFDQAVLAARS